MGSGASRITNRLTSSATHSLQVAGLSGLSRAALIALLLLSACDLAERDAQGVAKLLSARVIDTLLGCAMGPWAPPPRFCAWPAVAELDDLVELPAPSNGLRRDPHKAASHDDASA